MMFDWKDAIIAKIRSEVDSGKTDSSKLSAINTILETYLMIFDYSVIKDLGEMDQSEDKHRKRKT